MFDDDHAVANAGLALAGLLSEKLGLEELCDKTISVVPFPGRRAATLVHSLVVGGTCIDDADVLRSGSTSSVLSHRVMAPSTLGTFLRGFTFGHVRQLDRVSETLMTRAWALGAGARDRDMTVDLDSTILEVHGKQKEGASYGYTHVLGYHPLLATLRHRRDVARALSKGLGQHPARRPALRARGGGSVSTPGRVES
ncbi:MAG TPA: transposase [Acidimicrobiales bacterium]